MGGGGNHVVHIGAKKNHEIFSKTTVTSPRDIAPHFILAKVVSVQTVEASLYESVVLANTHYRPYRMTRDKQ